MSAVIGKYSWVFNWVDFGIAVRELRRERNISQETLAELCNVSPTMICNFENGTHEGDHMLKYIIAVANELDLMLPEYFELESDRKATYFVMGVDRIDK